MLGRHAGLARRHLVGRHNLVADRHPAVAQAVDPRKQLAEPRVTGGAELLEELVERKGLLALAEALRNYDVLQRAQVEAAEVGALPAD